MHFRFTALFFDHVGVTKLLDFKSSCVIKNRRKASKVKVLKFIDQNSALGCLSDKSLTKKQHQGNISQSIYRYCVDLCHFLVGRQNRPTLLQHSSPLSTDTKHSTVMYVCGGIFPTSPWYRMFSQCVLLCFLCACSFFKHYVTLHSTMYQKTHQLQLIALYSQQAL